MAYNVRFSCVEIKYFLSPRPEHFINFQEQFVLTRTYICSIFSLNAEFDLFTSMWYTMNVVLLGPLLNLFIYCWCCKTFPRVFARDFTFMATIKSKRIASPEMYKMQFYRQEK